ncbi:MAG: hypothetical protein ACT4N9_08465 [Paracoccaceae bacterium]
MATAEQVMHHLHRALKEGALPPQGRKIGAQLMAQLQRPARIAVIGLPGAGKSRLINLLIGADLMPDYGALPVVELAHGPAPRTQFTLADGTIAQREGLAGAAEVPPGTQRVSVLLCHAALRGRSFAEINLAGASGAQSAALDWMASRADLALWCSTGFDERERALWSAVPERLKDNSFLALTRADRLFMRGELDAQLARLAPVVADEFRALFAVATLQAAAARPGGVVRDARLWRSSGGMALTLGIEAQLAQARAADLDHASLLLERFKAPLGPAPRADLALAGGPGMAPAAGDRAEAVIRQALAALRGCAQDLIAAGGTARADARERILDRCGAAAGELVRLLGDQGAAPGALDPLRRDIAEGERMLAGLRLERGETVLEDSLTLLLQMKKDLGERIAG